ncbi:hypothetical protein P886_0317 [Alteromonadaceae bacterium 2753L.S.0a.02]|nr:hypothetical protein P886_0317 [Alteromonadaceae bacterium 2753L.S.0a.02]
MKGQCLCKTIQFEFEPHDQEALNCYCSICRQSHGADYATQVPSSKASLKFISGEDSLSEYQSSKFGIRAFCKHCGSRLMNYAKGDVSKYLSVSLSCIVEPHEIKPIANVQVASKAGWVEPRSDVESFDVFPDYISKYM